MLNDPPEYLGVGLIPVLNGSSIEESHLYTPEKIQPWAYPPQIRSTWKQKNRVPFLLRRNWKIPTITIEEASHRAVPPPSKNSHATAHHLPSHGPSTAYVQIT